MPVGEWASPGVRLSTRVVGISSDGAVAVVSIDNAFGASSFGVDLAARRIVWTAPDFKAAAVAGDTAVGPTTGSGAQGLGPSMLRGLAAATGVQRWSAADGGDVEVAGANLVAVAGKVYASGKSFFRLLAGDSGRQVQSADVSFENFPQCRWDERDVTVCFTAGFGDRAFGIDSNTARLLWQLPDQGGTRVAPQVITAAWHGAVYGETGNGSVVLDGRTGADRSADPGASPQLVNEYFGVGVPPGKKTDRVQVRRDLFLYPASG